jgi:hypothetical protein
MKRIKKKNKHSNVSAKNLGKLLGIADKRHTGKIIKNKHSSFGLLFLLMLTLLPVMNFSNLVLSTQTNSGNVSVTLLVSGPAPTIPATILSPTNGNINTANISVSGTCGPNLLVKIFNNSTFVGSVFCQLNGTFSINITLNAGVNNITALNYDNLNQPGPASPNVSVNLISGAGQQLSPKMIILTDSDYRQINPNTLTNWKFSLKNGQSPYNAFIDWGDGKNQKMVLNKAGDFDFSHSYSEPGKYNIILTITDYLGNQARIQLNVTVNGIPVAPIGPTEQPKQACDNSGNQLSSFGLLRCKIQSSLGQYWIVLYWLMMLVLGIFWLAAIKRRKREDEKSSKRRPIHTARA